MRNIPPALTEQRPTLSVREEVLWTIFGLALLLSFLALLIDDQLV